MCSNLPHKHTYKALPGSAVCTDMAQNALKATSENARLRFDPITDTEQFPVSSQPAFTLMK